MSEERADFDFRGYDAWKTASDAEGLPDAAAGRCIACSATTAGALCDRCLTAARAALAAER